MNAAVTLNGMTVNIGFVLLLMLAIAFSLGIGYALACRTVGSTAAKRNLAYAWPWFLVGALLAVALAYVGRFGLIVLYALYSIGVLLWLVSWPWRKRNAGRQLLLLGRTRQNKLLFWIGVVQSGLAVAMTLGLLDQVSDGWVTSGGVITGVIQIIFWWTIAYLFVLLGLSRLEIRENGIAYMFAWQPWERIQAFGWDDDTPNTLILKVYPRSPVSRKYLTISIPTAQVETVDRILEDYLIEADLDAEMEGQTPA